MMQYVLTHAGEEYLAKVNAQRINFRLSHAFTGSSLADDPTAATEITNHKQRLQIDDIELEGSKSIVHCSLSNLEVLEEYTVHQIGLYAYDSETKQTLLIIIGQDQEGDRIPTIAEREVEYLYNIGIKISNTTDITFDIHVNDFLRKEYFYQFVAEMRDKGRVVIGPADTPIGPNDICLVTDGTTAESFAEAGISNMSIGTDPIPGIDNFGRVEIVNGKLKVAKQPDADTTFFAQI